MIEEDALNIVERRAFKYTMIKEAFLSFDSEDPDEEYELEALLGLIKMLINIPETD